MSKANVGCLSQMFFFFYYTSISLSLSKSLCVLFITKQITCPRQTNLDIVYIACFFLYISLSLSNSQAFFYPPFHLFSKKRCSVGERLVDRGKAIFAHIPKTLGLFITHTRVSFLCKTWTYHDLTSSSVDLLPLTYEPINSSFLCDHYCRLLQTRIEIWLKEEC